jgi:hypothetical protein
MIQVTSEALALQMARIDAILKGQSSMVLRAHLQTPVV